MKRCCALLAMTGAALALGGPASAATHECDGLMICVPVAGPWVVVPAAVSSHRTRVEYQLSCPRGYVVGGLDAELSEPAIDIAFSGSLGSPVNPGISTSRAAVFIGTYVGAARRHTPSFRPHVGCLPTSGGGGRVPTALRAVPPGKPTVRHVSSLRVLPGIHAVTRRCAEGERLTAASHALAVYSPAPPTRRLVSQVSVRQLVLAGGVTITARSGLVVRGKRVFVQIGLVCAGGR